VSARRFLAPEVIQTSTMDCGPAALKCLLEGFGIEASFGRLREACQTSVDGTSIDTLEEVARQLGLDAEQAVWPVDHALLPESDALPAIAVLRMPGGGTHFVVLWRRHGRFFQVMDPGGGRRWVRASELERELYVHGMKVPAEKFRGWAGTAPFRAGFLRRLADLGIAGASGDALLSEALKEPGATPVARLDAAARMVASVVQAGGLRRGSESLGALRAIAAPGDQAIEIPPTFWAAWPLPAEEGDHVFLRGAVLVTARLPEQPRAAAEDRPAELTAALAERPARPLAELARLLREDGLAAPIFLIGALALAAAGTVVQAVLMRALFDARQYFLPGAERAGAVLAVVALVLALALLEVPLAAGLTRLGRHLELRVRAAYLDKLARLGDRYFGSRLASDMAERGHALHLVRRLPDIGARLVRALFALSLTTAGIAWLSPRSGPIAALIALAAVAVPLAFGPLLSERHLRFRTHQGALTRFYLDALVGLIPIRAHNAARTVRREHEGLLVDWVQAGYSVQKSSMIVDAAVALSALALSTWLLARHLSTGLEAGSALLLVYWTLQLPVLGEEVAATVRMYPALRGVTMRLLELLNAPEERGDEGTATAAAAGPGMEIVFENVTARAGGHELLRQIDLRVRAGEHVAIVGPSGAGKSSLMSVLMGWLTPSEGRVLVDGVPLVPASLAAHRQATAWLDPGVHLWNRTLLDNILYGAPPEAVANMPEILAASELRRVIPHLPDGLQTQLGESGALLSGGEGQRVRLARALSRAQARLAILDEPFRGLDRQQRRTLLAGTRDMWRAATLFCVSHDLAETQGFDRVLVIEDGNLVEDDSPGALMARADSRYRALMIAEDHALARLWSRESFRRMRLEQGTLRETGKVEA
jgi:ABC-type bacteriocin/lantibiotic exporter with double-glycine peptidase domain